MSEIFDPFPFFTDTAGHPLDDGFVYIGQAGLDAQDNQIPVFWDSAQTQSAAQPISTSAGYIMYQGAVSHIFSSEASWSIKVLDKQRRLVFDSRYNYAKASESSLSGPSGSSLIGFRQIGIGATNNTVQGKLRERAITLLDYVDEADRADVVSGVTSANAGFAAMAAAAVTEGRPARITKGSYFFDAQASLPANLKLYLEDGAEPYFDDDTLESMWLIEDDGVEIYGSVGARLRGPETEHTAFLQATCLLIRGASNVVIKDLNTYAGWRAVIALDCDNLVLDNVWADYCYSWGISSGGNRNCTFRNTTVSNTRKVLPGGGGDSDAHKIFGVYTSSVGQVWSARSSYNLNIINPIGINTGGGQTLDIISLTNATDDLHGLIISNPYGRNNGNGLLEIKCGPAVTSAWAVRDVTVIGGKYDGNGTESSGVSVNERVDGIKILGTVISDVQQGFNIANPARGVVLENVKTYRTRMEGIQWPTGAGSQTGCAIINCEIVDPNYGQGASTYSGISLLNVSNIRVVNPVVRRSQAPSGSAHPYGIEITVAASNIMIEGTPSLSGHATGAVNDLSTTTRWPVTYTTEINLANGAAASFIGITNLPQAFYAARIRHTYLQASNITRNVDVQARSTTGSTAIGATIATSASAVIWTEGTQAINPPMRLPVSNRTAIVAQSALDPDYPGSPTGILLLTFEGFNDGSSAA